MINRSRDLIRVVEAAYQIELDEQSWLDGLVEVFSKMPGSELGLMLYIYDATRPEQGVDIPAYALSGLDEAFARSTRLHNKHTPADDARRVYRRGVHCSTVSEILAPHGIVPTEHASFGRFRQGHQDVVDAWGLSASNPDGRGIGIAAPLYEITTVDGAMRELWELVGVHLATAYRLRRTRGEPAAEAILEPDGRLLHAERGDIADRWGEELADAARRIDRARSDELRKQAGQALPLWKGLVEGRWSLIDHVDADGRRYVVAHPNGPNVANAPELSRREWQVLAYAAQGDDDARIAYSLGIEKARVARLLAGAMDKLGVESRQALSQLRRSDSDDSDESDESDE